MFAQLEDARKGNKEGSRERNEKMAAAQTKIEVHIIIPSQSTSGRVDEF